MDPARMTRSLLLVSIAASALVFVPLTAFPSASADVWGECTTDTGCVPENTAHSWCFSNSTDGHGGLKDAMRWSTDNMDNQTEMSEIELVDCFDTTDVIWRNANPSNLTMGQYVCIDQTGLICRAANVTVNLEAIDFIADDPDDNISSSDGDVESGEITFNRELTACHEVGHSIGLTHHGLPWYDTNPNDCLINPWREAERIGEGWRDYNGHHVDHVNDNM